MSNALRRAALALVMIGFTAASALGQNTEVRIGLVLEPPALDPTANTAAAVDEVTYGNIFEGLTRIDQTGAVQPALATSWTISPDNLTYTFTLAGNVAFHDGTSFDAEDVKFTFDRILAPQSTNAQKALYQVIASVVVADPQTVTFTLTRPNGDFLFNLGRGDAVIVAPESAADNATRPVGTGPFRFVQWDKGSRVVLEQNPNYWGQAVQLTRATFVFISDPSTAIAAMLSGDLDGFVNFPGPEALDIFKSNPQFRIVEGSTEGETILAINNRKPPFDDLRVRQAIAHAINRDELIDAAYGYGTPIGSHFAPHHPYYLDLTGTYPYDVQRAKTLLAEAGMPEGFSATLKLPPTPYARRGGQILASQLAAIGIRVEQINVEWAQWITDVFTNKDFDLTVISHVEPFDIGIYANPDYYFGYTDPDFQTIMSELNATTDETARKALAQQAQKRLADQAVNGFLYELAQVGVWNSKLEGYWQNQPIEGAVLTELHWVP